MRKDKEKIIEMRREGMSYRSIQKETGVSRATLVTWFKDEVWSRHKKATNTQRNITIAHDRIVRMNLARKNILDDFYTLQQENATKEYETYKNEPLFWAGLMIYAGEGDKRSRGMIRVSNSEAYIHRIFIQFSVQYFAISKSFFKYALLLYPDLDDVVCKKYWVEELDIVQGQFHKTQVLKGKEAVKRLQYGVGMTILMDTGLKKKLLKWLELAQRETF